MKSFVSGVGREETRTFLETATPPACQRNATEALERLHDEVKCTRSVVFQLHDRLIGNDSLPGGPVEAKQPSKVVLNNVIEDAVDSLREARQMLEMLNDSVARQLSGVRIE